MLYCLSGQAQKAVKFGQSDENLEPHIFIWILKFSQQWLFSLWGFRIFTRCNIAGKYKHNT
jgi:hypothetical protein